MTQQKDEQHTYLKMSLQTIRGHALNVSALADELQKQVVDNTQKLSLDAATTAAAIIYGNLLRKPKD